MPNGLDEESRKLQAEIDAVIRRWAGDDDREYLRRWRQLGTWSINRAEGDVVKKARLKKRLMEKTQGRCQGCDLQFEAPALQMHRLEASYALDRSRNMGYFDENVELLCVNCHQARETERRLGG